MAGNTDRQGVYTGKGGYQYVVLGSTDAGPTIGVVRPDGSRTIVRPGEATHTAIVAELRGVAANMGTPEVGHKPGRSAADSGWRPAMAEHPTTKPVPPGGQLPDTRYLGGTFLAPVAGVSAIGAPLAGVETAMAGDRGASLLNKADDYQSWIDPTALGSREAPAGTWTKYRSDKQAQLDLLRKEGARALTNAERAEAAFLGTEIMGTAAGMAAAGFNASDAEWAARRAAETSNRQQMTATAQRNAEIAADNRRTATGAAVVNPRDIAPDAMNPSDEEWSDFKNTVTVKNSKKK